MVQNVYDKTKKIKNFVLINIETQFLILYKILDKIILQF